MAALYLLTNDDGVHAPGIRALAGAVAGLGEAVVVAPHVERSATSHSISIHSPLRVESIQPGWWAVEGTPADCVMLACRRLLTRKPSWVLSGINRGGNLGIDTLYSGTVHAAMEGSLHGYKSMAISLQGKTGDLLRWETAAKVTRLLLEKGDALDVPPGMTVNVNVPNLEFADLKGFAIAGLGRRVYDEQIVEGVDPRGRPYYWLGAGGEMFEDIPGSDCLLLDQGWVTVSMLRPSLLDVDANQRMAAKLPSLFSDVFGNSR